MKKLIFGGILFSMVCLIFQPHSGHAMMGLNYGPSYVELIALENEIRSTTDESELQAKLEEWRKLKTALRVSNPELNSTFSPNLITINESIGSIGNITLWRNQRTIKKEIKLNNK